MPRPGTQLFRPGWEAHHEPVAELQMTATCEVRRPSSASTIDPSAHRSVYPTPAVLFTSRCRVQRYPVRGGGGQPIGGRAVTEQRYQVSIPRDVTPVPQINDQAVVTDSTDPSLAGLVLRVTEVRSGTLRWQRDLTCEGVTPTTR